MQSAKKIFSKSITVGRTLLLRAGSNLLLGMFLAGGFIQSASAQEEAYAVDVYLGYLNNLPIGTGLPDVLKNGGFNFDGQNVTPTAPQNVTLIGVPLDKPHDTGVIMFANRGHFPVVIHLDELTVTVQGDCPNGPIFRPWATEAIRRSFGTTFTLGSGEFLVLAETTEDFNFDTSDCGLDSDPVVTGRITTDRTPDLPFQIKDTKRVLLGKEESKDAAESTPYELSAILRPQLRPGTGPLLVRTEARCVGATVGEVIFFNFGDAAADFTAAGHVTDNGANGTLSAVASPPSGTINPGGMVDIVFSPPASISGFSLIGFDYIVKFDNGQEDSNNIICQ